MRNLSLTSIVVSLALLLGIAVRTNATQPKLVTSELLTPQQQLEVVGEELNIDLSHITIIKHPLAHRLRGVACSPTLIITNAYLWDKTGNAKNFIHILHEVGHTLGLVHYNVMYNMEYKGEPIDISESAMSTPSPEPLRAFLFREYYIKEMQNRIKEKTRVNFWKGPNPIAKPETKSECLNSVKSPHSWERLLIDWK